MPSWASTMLRSSSATRPAPSSRSGSIATPSSSSGHDRGGPRRAGFEGNLDDLSPSAARIRACRELLETGVRGGFERSGLDGAASSRQLPRASARAPPPLPRGLARRLDADRVVAIGTADRPRPPVRLKQTQTAPSWSAGLSLGNSLQPGAKGSTLTSCALSRLRPNGQETGGPAAVGARRSGRAILGACIGPRPCSPRCVCSPSGARQAAPALGRRRALRS